MTLSQTTPPKTKLSEAFVELVKAIAHFVRVKVRERSVPTAFLRSLDDFKQNRVVSDDTALDSAPPPKM